jgi:acyl-CoA reductase-like NAD-dependent aldehyde dehydrogenase
MNHLGGAAVAAAAAAHASYRDQLRREGRVDAQPGHACHRDPVDPATGDRIGAYAMAGPKEAHAAIEAAKRAFAEPAWRTNRLLRAQVLNRMADRFEERADDLVEVLGLENGKTHDQGRLEVAFAPDTLRFNAALALTDTGTNSQVTDGELSLVVRQPVGVAGIIAPWNSPVALGIRSLARALAAGCTRERVLARCQRAAPGRARARIGSVWVNDWAKLHDQFEEGGFKGSGAGRMRGFAVMDDFVEFKHIRLRPGTTPAV